MAGYSGTALAAKLGIKPGTVVLAVDAPAEYCDLLAPIPDRVSFGSRLTTRSDLIPVFSISRARLANRQLALPLGLVDVKVCAVDATWSGLKLVVRREQRHSNPSLTPRAKKQPARRYHGRRG